MIGEWFEESIQYKKEGENMVDTVALEKVMINNCIEHFNSLNGEREFFESREECGHIPSVLHIEYCEAIKRTKDFYKLIPKKQWKYENSVIVEMSLETESENKDIQKDGIFYVFARAKIYYDLENKKGFLDIVFGPRFARGFSYDIHIDGENISLENEKVEWVS